MLLALLTNVLSSAPPPPTGDDPRQSAARSKVGTTLRGKWHLNELLAVGGMGAVYDATHRNGMRGAVKVLDPCLSQSVEARQRFLREGRLANRVHHAGAVRVLDDDETADGTAYLVMELLEGSTLEALAARSGGKLDPAMALELGLQVVDTLAEAHASGIVHRDIKPENLFLTNEGVVKVVDFGIAGMLAQQEGSPMLTRSGELIGTPAFMSPEQARGRWELVDHQSDLYSLGASLFSLLTGALVHDSAGTVAEMLALAITVNPASLAEKMPEAPAALVTAIDGALKLDKSERWANAATMRTALEEGYLALTGNAAPPPRVRSPSAPPARASAPERLRRAVQTTLNLPRPPRLRWVISGGIVAAACAVAMLAVIVPRGLAVASPGKERAPTLMLVAASSGPSTTPIGPPPPPSLAPITSAGPPAVTPPASSPGRRYDPVYDRRH